MPHQRPRTTLTLEDAEIIGLKALAFLADDEARIGRFLALTGLSTEELRAQASNASMLQAVLEHLAGDESLLLVFAAEASLEPDRIGPALQVLAAEAATG